MLFSTVHERQIKGYERIVDNPNQIGEMALDVAERRLKQIGLDTDQIVKQIQENVQNLPSGISVSLKTCESVFHYVVMHPDAASHLLMGTMLDYEAGKFRPLLTLSTEMWKHSQRFPRIAKWFIRNQLASLIQKVDFPRFNGDESIFGECAALFGADSNFQYYDQNKDRLISHIDQAKLNQWFRSDCHLDDWVCFVYAATQALLVRFATPPLEAKQQVERTITSLRSILSSRNLSLDEDLPLLAQVRQSRWDKGLTEERCRWALMDYILADPWLCEQVESILSNSDRRFTHPVYSSMIRPISMRGGMIGRNCTGEYVNRVLWRENLPVNKQKDSLQMEIDRTIYHLRDDLPILYLVSALVAATNGIVAEQEGFYPSRLQEENRIRDWVRFDLNLTA